VEVESRKRRPLYPAETCLNLAYFHWLESTTCLCTSQSIDALRAAAAAAASSATWALAGVLCLWLGGMLGSVQGAADLALIRSVQELLARQKRRRFRQTSRPPAYPQASDDSESVLSDKGGYATSTGGNGNDPVNNPYMSVQAYTGSQNPRSQQQVPRAAPAPAMQNSSSWAEHSSAARTRQMDGAPSAKAARLSRGPSGYVNNV
jgi:hypothetical protein